MTQQDLKHVPDRTHYQADYVGGTRIFSYAHQINSVMSFSPETVLEVGVGGGVVTAALRALGMQVTTVDVQPELNPDVQASVTDLPFPGPTFDVALCSQVLEHLPLDIVDKALGELRRVIRKGAVLSVPDITRPISLSWTLPMLGSGKMSTALPRSTDEAYRRDRLERMGHYWEIGFPGASLHETQERIRAAGWSIDRVWRVPEMPWHRFFALTPVPTQK